MTIECPNKLLSWAIRDGIMKAFSVLPTNDLAFSDNYHKRSESGYLISVLQVPCLPMHDFPFSEQA